jgi:hypothetical protein
MGQHTQKNDNPIDINTYAVISQYRRGYNSTGNPIPAFKFIALAGGYFSNYPLIQISAGNSPCIGLLTSILPNAQGTKVIYYGLIQFPSGIIDTTAIPLNTPVYISNTGDLTLNYTNLKAGHVMTQGVSPWIFLNVQYSTERYIEFPFVNLTNQVFNHDFRRYTNFIIVNASGDDITSGLSVNHDTNKQSVTVQSNVPITGSLVCSCD